MKKAMNQAAWLAEDDLLVSCPNQTNPLFGLLLLRDPHKFEILRYH